MLKSSGSKKGYTTLPGGASDWLASIGDLIPGMMDRAGNLGFGFLPGKRPQPNSQGRTPTTMEWARRLTAEDIAILKGKGEYCEQLPEVDDGFSAADLKDPAKRDAIFMVVQERWKKAMDSHPNGYLVRHVPDEDVQCS